jgi:lactate dehydrogenase-like 2-hydroxyacid dehydrogenase
VRLSLAGFRRHRVLLTDVAYPELLSRLDPFFEVELAGDVDLGNRDVLRACLAGKSALVDSHALAIDAPLLASLPHLKAACRIGSSHAGIDLEACTRAGVIATNTSDLGSDDTARRKMALAAADNLIAAFGFGRAAGHPKNLLNTELRCMLGCCL